MNQRFICYSAKLLWLYLSHLKELYNSLKKRQVYLILDEAHSCNYFYNNLHKQHCDAIIFSFRKQFPVLKGGGFIIFGYRFEDSNRRIPYPMRFFRLSLDIVILQMKKFLIRVRLKFNFLRDLTIFKYFSANTKVTTVSYKYKVSQLLSSLLIDTRILSKIANKRICAFNLYDRELKTGIGLNFNSSKDVPQVYPIVGSESLLKFLNSQGVAAYLWPADDLDPEVKRFANKFPSATKLAHSILCLPCHQEIEVKHVNRVVSLIEEFNTQK